MKIYIDVGHGETGADSGASGFSKYTYYENDRNLKIALVVEDFLKNAGHEIVMSRKENKNIGNLVGSYGRADSNLINSANKVDQTFDFMISIHCNDSENADARGIWMCAKNDDLSKKIANEIAESFLTNYKKHQHTMLINNISEDYKNYGILRLHKRPGVLVECGFMSNAKDLHEILCNSVGIGEAVANGILKVIGEKTNPILEEIKNIEKSLENIKNFLDKNA